MYLSPEFRAQPPDFAYDSFELPENVELVFHLNSHNGSADLPPQMELRSNIRMADAVILEASSNTDPTPDLNKISRGDLKTYHTWRNYMSSGNVEFGEWFGSFLRALYDTKTPITTIDVPPSSLTMRALASRMRTWTKAKIAAETNQDAADLTEQATDTYQSYRERDQLLLANLKPRLESLTSSSKFLKQKRSREPAQIDIYYGDAHRSLYDAVLHKNAVEPTDGFSARLHPNSIAESLPEASYAYFLRTGEASEELVVLEGCITTIAAALYAYNPICRREPIVKLRNAAERILDGGTYEDALSIRNILRDEPQLMSDATAEV